MTQEESRKPAVRLVFEYELDASPEKVWRAISIPELRANWLPEQDLACSEPAGLIPEQEAVYRLRETTPPFLESTVTFQIAANDDGGTSLKIIHELEDAQFSRKTTAANSNSPVLMRAA